MPPPPALPGQHLRQDVSSWQKQATERVQHLPLPNPIQQVQQIPPPQHFYNIPSSRRRERNLCFPGNARVTRRHADNVAMETVEMSELSAGDDVTTLDAHTGRMMMTKVLGFLDRFPRIRTEYVELHVHRANINGGGNDRHAAESISVTEDHLIFIVKAEDKPTQVKVSVEQLSTVISSLQAKEVEIGDFIVVSNGTLSESCDRGDQTMKCPPQYVLEPVIQVSHVWLQGAYSPLTRTGTLLVNDVMMSSYGEVNSHWVADVMMSPLKLWWSIFPYTVAQQHPISAQIKCSNPTEHDQTCRAARVVQEINKTSLSSTAGQSLVISRREDNVALPMQPHCSRRNQEYSNGYESCDHAVRTTPDIHSTRQHSCSTPQIPLHWYPQTLLRISEFLCMTMSICL
eukprot:scpid71680/ scgid18128/ Desert hedgehog protein A; Cephalic hedgehog protein; Desert hedgehog protein 1; X-CHH; Desert hedgehog protein A N-product; Desert hedgehog protein A C-product